MPRQELLPFGSAPPPIISVPSFASGHEMAEHLKISGGEEVGWPASFRSAYVGASRGVARPLKRTRLWALESIWGKSSSTQHRECSYTTRPVDEAPRLARRWTAS